MDSRSEVFCDFLCRVLLEMKELAGLGDPCRDRERRDSWPAAVFQVSPLSSILPLNVNEKGEQKGSNVLWWLPDCIIVSMTKVQCEFVAPIHEICRENSVTEVF